MDALLKIANTAGTNSTNANSTTGNSTESTDDGPANAYGKLSSTLDLIQPEDPSDPQSVAQTAQLKLSVLLETQKVVFFFTFSVLKYASRIIFVIIGFFYFMGPFFCNNIPILMGPCCKGTRCWMQIL